MPNIKSNRVQVQKRKDRNNNLMQGPGRRFTARIEAQEATIIRKLQRKP